MVDEAPNSISALAPGEKDVNDMMYAGATPQDVTEYKSSVASDMRNAGAQDQEIKDYFGIKEPDMKNTKSFVNTNLQNFVNANREAAANKEGDQTIPSGKSYAHTLTEHIEAAWQQSNLGMLWRNKLPDIQQNPDDGTAYRLMNTAVGAGADLPIFAAGGIGGAVVGQAAMPELPGAGALLGTPTGAFALESGMRKMLIDHYEKGDIKDSSDFIDRLIGTTWASMKGAATGFGAALTGGASEALTAGAPALVSGATKLATESAVFTGLSKGLEGQMPDYQDFLNNALLIGGMHAGAAAMGYMPQKLMSIYKNTGEHPSEVMQAAENDPVLKGELLSSNPDLPAQVKSEHGPDTESVSIPRDHDLVQPMLPGMEAPEENPTADIPAQPEADEPKIPEQPAGEEYPDAVKKVMAQIVDRPESVSSGLKPRDFIKSMVNDLDPIDQMVRAAKEGGANTPDIPGAAQSPDVVLGNFRNKWAGVARSAFTKGTLDFNTGKVNGESAAKIVGDIPDGNMTALNAYMASARTLEVSDNTGRETAISPQDAQETVDALKEKFGPIAKRVTAYRNRLLDYMTDAGLVDPALNKKMKEGAAVYTPLHTLQDIDPLTGQREGPGGMFNKIKGAEEGSKLLNPFDQVMQDTPRMIRAAELNRAIKSVADFPNFEDYGKESSPPNKMVVAGPKDMMKWMEENGIDMTEISKDDLNGLKIFRPGDVKLADNEITFKRNGQIKILTLQPDMSDAIKSLIPDPPSANVVLKLLKTSSNIVRGGTVLMPDFIARHFGRSGIIAAMQSDHPLRTQFNGLIDSMGDMVGDKDAWSKFTTSGAASGEVEKLHALLEKEPWKISEETGMLDPKNTWNAPTSKYALIKALRYMGEVGDSATRIREFKKTGGASVEASADTIAASAAAARAITIDPIRMGSFVRQYGSATPFVNAGIQGLARMSEEIANNPAKYISRGAALITAPSVLTWAHGHGDPRYDDAPFYQKAFFWVWPTNKWEAPQSQADIESRPDHLKRQLEDGSWEVNNGITIRIPKPFEPGVLFGSMPEMLLARYADGNPNALNHMGETIAHGILPNILPPLITAGLEQATNHNFFRGGSLVSDHMAQELPGDRQHSYTSEVAKQMAYYIGKVPVLRDIGPKEAPLSAPIVIDNYIRDLGGTGGQLAVQAIDAALHAAGIGDTQVKPTTTVNDIPFVKGFLIKYPEMQTQSMVDFQEKEDFATQVQNSVRAHAKAGDTDGAQQLSVKYASESDKLSGIQSAVSNANKIIQMVNRDPKMTKDDKRQLIDQTMWKATTAAQEGLKIMDSYKKSIENAPKQSEVGGQ